jgi:hypothetical protein
VGAFETPPFDTGMVAVAPEGLAETLTMLASPRLLVCEIR